MKNPRKYLPYILVAILLIASFCFIYLSKIKDNSNKDLMVAFLDVGQGDAIFIEAPNGKQVLIDGGPDAKILQRLSEVMPFGDRSLDLLVATHPDSDHISGLVFVLDKYKVSTVMDNGYESESQIYKDLNMKISKNKVNEIIAKNPMKIILDKENNIYFDVLAPIGDSSLLDSNDASIVVRLVYGQKSFMLTGDATLYTENVIYWNEDVSEIKSQVLKLGHHGSKTSSSFLWLEDVSPDIAIISAGKNNRYGHPNQEVIDRMERLKIPYLATYDLGNIIFKTDGVDLSIIK